AGAIPAAVAAAGRTLLGAGRYGTQFAAPLLAAGLVVRGRRRSAAAALLLAGPLTAWATARPRLDPVRFTAAAIADDVAYGCGVWAGCLARRTALPLRPRLARRPPTRLTRRSGP
ncbi:MAG: mftF, partial [Mycobacterium sp.]|nr:mftF [Mycobacterium sp.]